MFSPYYIDDETIPPFKPSTSTAFTNYTKDEALRRTLKPAKKVSMMSLMPGPRLMPASELIKRRRAANSVSSATSDSGFSGIRNTVSDDDEYTAATMSTFLGAMSNASSCTMLAESVDASNSAGSSGSFSTSSSSGRHSFTLSMKVTPSTSYAPLDIIIEPTIGPPPNAEAIPVTSLESMVGATTSSPAKSTNIFKRLRNKFKMNTSCMASAESIEYIPVNNGPYVDDLGDNWIKIKYRESKDVYGTNYESSSTEVNVTGLSQLNSANRFALCTVARPRRNPIVQRTRRLIKEGIRFYYESRNVWLDCLGPPQIFVQAPLYAYCLGQPLSTVFRLQQGNGMPIFSASAFDYLLTEGKRIGETSIATIEQMCFIRVSFVKGWGQEYAIKSALDLPVWLEAYFLHAYADVDCLHANLKESRRFKSD